MGFPSSVPVSSSVPSQKSGEETRALQRSLHLSVAVLGVSDVVRIDSISPIGGSKAPPLQQESPRQPEVRRSSWGPGAASTSRLEDFRRDYGLSLSLDAQFLVEARWRPSTEKRYERI